MNYKREELDYIAAQLIPVVLEKLGVEAQGVSEVEIVTDLTGVYSLPAYKKVDGTEKVVEAPVSLLQGVALDAVKSATDTANTAAANADRKREELEQSETTRASNEETRQKQEAARQEAEKKRETQEETRQTQETKRGTDTAAQLEELETARQNAVNATTKAATATETATKAAGVATAATEEALAAAARAGSTATTAEAEIEKMKQLQESISGAASLAPTRMELTYTKRITRRNPYVQRIVVRLFPSYALQNVLFLGDEGAVSVEPDGRVTPKRTGRSRVHVIPTQATHLYETIEIEVAAPSVRLTGNGKIRLDSKGNIRLT